jgi:tRNA A-37 threonylcarbamoyl transferase component Bud32
MVGENQHRGHFIHLDMTTENVLFPPGGDLTDKSIQLIDYGVTLTTVSQVLFPVSVAIADKVLCGDGL